MKRFFFILVLTLAVASMASADVANLVSSKCGNNGTYNATYMTRNYGVGSPTFSGWATNWGVGDRFIPVEWDVSSIGAVASVDDSVITFTYVVHAWNVGGAQTHAVSSIDGPWIEGTGTAAAPANCTLDGSMCPNNLGSITAITTVTQANTQTDLVIDDPLIDALIADWCNGVKNNYGLYIGPSVSLTGGIASVSSDEDNAGTPLATAPKLDVTYTPGTPVSDWYLY